MYWKLIQKIPIHRHRDTSEVVIILRGKVREVYFDNQGNEIASYLLEYGSPIPRNLCS